MQKSEIFKKLKIYKKNSNYADFLFGYPSTYIFKCIKTTEFNLNNVKNKNNLLYIHIPFCANICKFCNVNKQKLNKYDEIIDYLLKLKEEIIFFSRRMFNVEFDGIYIGGGTPTLLNEKDLENLFIFIYEKFKFKKNIYIEVDASPSTITYKKLEVFKKFGVSQLSMGIQSMDEKVLNNIARIGQTYLVLDNLSNLFKDYKFNLHFDFVIGLPGEKLEELEKSIRYVVEKFKPYSISINGYDNTPDTLLYKEYREYFKTKYYLDKTKYNKDFISKLLKNDYGIERKKTFYFKKFLENHYNVIGIGSGAFGFIRGKGVYKNLDYKDYILDDKNQKYFYKFDKKDEKIMFIIHNYNSKNLNTNYKKLFKTTIYKDFFDQINYLNTKGLVEIFDNNIIFKFKNNIIANFELINLYSDNIIKLYDLRNK